MSSSTRHGPHERLLQMAFASQWVADERFRRALGRLYGSNCHDLPESLAARWAQPHPSARWARPRSSWAEDDIDLIEELATVDEAEPGHNTAAAVWARRFLAATGRLAHRWGLDRWQPADAQRLAFGQQLVMRWCVLRVGSPWATSRRFAAALPPATYSVRTSTIDVHWDPSIEDYDAARARLRHDLDQILAATKAEWTEAGLLHPVPSNTLRDIRWVYWRVQGWSMAEIAREHNRISRIFDETDSDESDITREAVQRATTRMALRLGVRLT